MNTILVFATNNEHKLGEIRALMPAEIEVVSLSQLGFRDEIEETGKTLKENARIKAQRIWEEYFVDVFADDTGLEVDALGGAPGVHTARYAYPDRHDPEANTHKLLEALDGVEQRTARFKTVICFICAHKEYFFEGVVEGEIATEPRGTEGFGYDPVFIPYDEEINPDKLTFAQLGAEAKNRISHRGRAIAKLVAFVTARGNLARRACLRNEADEDLY